MLPVLCFLLLFSTTPALAKVTESPFGKTATGEKVQQFTITNSHGLSVNIITRGATLQSLIVPDKEGKLEDILLGFDSVAGYESEDNQYFSCTVGRVCNRIGNAQFELFGETYKLHANDGNNTLHGGGARSLDKVVWKASLPEDQENTVELTYFSPDGEEGFPGNVHFSVRYSLTEKNALAISYKATTDMETPINMTNHAYFNLSGAGAETVLDHILQIDADQITPTDDELIPTGEFADVEGTALDFREPTVIGERIAAVDKTAAIGYDHNWVLNHQNRGVRKVATLEHPSNGRMIHVVTDQPGLQFYSGNFLKGQEGKGGKTYAHRSAICLETQFYPDSVHHEDFPSIILVPGETYSQTTLYQFKVKED
ncbi:Aldose 1-epimerase precursor [Roseimaritima multifibrata]|uniref:Aldose 1-epimerase n=1 Tax=Roseimaritima multifibrata TaxID=1930274 RepID=A0A517MD79_9BACT|nr:aldose epimerase family protein [Roseimaritima multifibrata]QDS92737.1 Aldose 1-epimerase precursor [Roseimaritima multifibrata]